MVEPPQLRAARQHLSQAESEYRSDDGLFHLEEGLALLDEMMAGDVPAIRTIAQNLASTYATKIFGCVRKLVETDRGLPEPDLEHLFKVVLAFDDRGFELPAEARSAKITVVERLVDRYYEGHSPEEKRAALEELAKISGRPQADT
jgi:hypothetical protein